MHPLKLRVECMVAALEYKFASTTELCAITSAYFHICIVIYNYKKKYKYRLIQCGVINKSDAIGKG